LVSAAAALVFFGESLGVSTASHALPNPPVNDWLATRPAGTVIIQFPAAFPGTYSEGTEYFYAYYHHFHHLNEIGTNVAAPNAGSDLATELWLAGTSTAGELRAAGVRYAVSHTGAAYNLSNTTDVLAALPGLTPVWSAQGDTVYEVTGPAVPFAYLTGDFQIVEPRAPGEYARWMGASGHLEVVNPYPHAVSAVLRLRLWCLGDCRTRVVIRGDGIDQNLKGTETEDIRVQLPPGQSRIDLIPPNPPRRISPVEDRKVTLYVFRPVLTPVKGPA
jgi:hypothetical protein